MLADLLRQRTKHVRWTEDEWVDLAKRVHRKRARNPDMTLYELINAVQDQPEDKPNKIEAWPEERKRKVAGISQCRPIIAILRKLDQDLRERVFTDIPRLEQQIESLRQRPDKETVLKELSEAEILRRFTEIVFRNHAPSEILSHFSVSEVLHAVPAADIFAFVGKALFGSLSALELQMAQHVNNHSLHQVNGHANGHANVEKKTNGTVARFKSVPRVAVLGLQQHQLEILKSHVGAGCEIVYVPKGQTKQQIDLPADCDHYVVWETNVSAQNKRSIQRITAHEKLTVHSGTFNEMIPKIQALPFMGRGKVKPK